MFFVWNPDEKLNHEKFHPCMAVWIRWVTHRGWLWLLHCVTVKKLLHPISANFLSRHSAGLKIRGCSCQCPFNWNGRLVKTSQTYREKCWRSFAPYVMGNQFRTMPVQKFFTVTQCYSTITIKNRCVGLRPFATLPWSCKKEFMCKRFFIHPSGI